MKVLLVSEGKHELGGALETLVRRLLPRELYFDHDQVSRADIHTHRGKGQGFFKRAVRWLFEARKRGYEALVLVVDEDGRAERVKEISAAQQYGGVALPRAMGIAIRTFDAWMLADERALTFVLKYQVHRQPEPETISDPKRMCADLCGSRLSQTEMYAQLATVIVLSTLEQRCPLGFGPFAAKVRAL